MIRLGRKRLRALTLVGPHRDNPKPDPLASPWQPTIYLIFLCNSYFPNTKVLSNKTSQVRSWSCGDVVKVKTIW